MDCGFSGFPVTANSDKTWGQTGQNLENLGTGKPGGKPGDRRGNLGTGKTWGQTENLENLGTDGTFTSF
jgi:hypothetical protein